jgi:protein SCO1
MTSWPAESQGSSKEVAMASKKFLIAGFVFTMLSVNAEAQRYGVTQDYSLPAVGLPPVIQGIKIDQNLNAQVPLELSFKNEAGQPVRLGQYFGQKPVVLALVYYECPGLCDLVLNGLLDAMETSTLKLGTDFQAVTVSFNPEETWQLAASKKANYIEKLKSPGGKEGWHFLTGQEDQIRPLADTVGFHYRYDPATKLYAHASGIMVLTPEGKVARYFYGVQYKPRDVRLALVEASKNKIGSAADELLLFCYHYDPTKGRYGLMITNILRVLASATALALGAFVFVMIRRDRHSHPTAAGRPA